MTGGLIDLRWAPAKTRHHDAEQDQSGDERKKNPNGAVHDLPTSLLVLLHCIGQKAGRGVPSQGAAAQSAS